MNRPSRVLALCATAVALLTLFALPASAGEGKTVTKTFPFVGDRDVRVGVRAGSASIDSFRVRNWPDDEELDKGDHDHGDSTTMVVEFTYTNRDDDHDYNCQYVVRILGPGGEEWAENDRTASLDKGKYEDTNRMFVKMKTYRFRRAKKIEISFRIWRD